MLRIETILASLTLFNLVLVLAIILFSILTTTIPCSRPVYILFRNHIYLPHRLLSSGILQYVWGARRNQNAQYSRALAS